MDLDSQQIGTVASATQPVITGNGSSTAMM
jgi:hypothetical protein